MNCENHITGNKETTLQRILQTGPLRLLLAGMYFLLGVSRPAVYVSEPVPQSFSRYEQRRAEREQRLVAPRISHTHTLRPLFPRALSRTQYLERLTRIAVIGRFQIYNWLYYRWEFWRVGAVARRCQAPQGASGPVALTTPLGLSAEHLGPD